MRVSGINGITPQPGQAGLQQTDAVGRNIQKQIAQKQKELQNLSSNQELDMEEKEKKRKEIMQEINNLNNQLRQHQIEQRREAANAGRNQEKDSSVDDMIGGNRRSSKGAAKSSGLSQTSMKAMILADSALDQAQVQGSVAAEMENRINILKTEIKQDAGRTDVTAKKQELAGMEQRMEHASAAQADILRQTNQDMEKAQKSEGAEETVEKEEDRKDNNPEEQKYPSVDVYL